MLFLTPVSEVLLEQREDVIATMRGCIVYSAHSWRSDWQARGWCSRQLMAKADKACQQLDLECIANGAGLCHRTRLDAVSAHTKVEAREGGV